MSVGAIGGSGHFFGSSHAAHGPGTEDGKPPTGGQGPHLGDAEPVNVPTAGAHGESNIEIDGPPKVEIEPRVHLHPAPLIEPRPVFHYDEEPVSGTGKRVHKPIQHPGEDQFGAATDKKPERRATTYDRHARESVVVSTRPMIDLFV